MPTRRSGAPAAVLGAALAVTVLLGACSGDDGTVAGPVSTAGGSTAVTSEPAGEPGGGGGAAPSVRPTPTVEQTPVAPPGGEGDLAPVPTAAVLTLPPVPLDQPAQVGPGLEVRIGDVEAVEVTGRGPGQVSGPAVAVTVEVANAGAAALDVAGLAVSLAYADTEAGPVDGPPADPVAGPVPAGADVSGTYVFLVPEDQRAAVTVRVGLASQPVVVFTGSATT